MFHLHVWKVLAEVAAAGCNARLFTVTFLLDRHKRTGDRKESEPGPGVDEGLP